ncbi:S-layer homology domain-containing protein [Paenibacillus sinopodophylli]|uniref:S-layer homology domain-containing protein n=1 Tax=Paenibacillus sinopodophylli TaxID=1837342 RepID=UPI00110CC226|nr:S-layer homology domain-containing protein [Paenibacillus sinopodophylli]
MNSSFRKKVSLSLVSLMLLSMLAPVLSYAAAYMVFQYNERTGELSGGIYTADPDNIKVERIDQSGVSEFLDRKVSNFSYKEYDANNVPYEWVYFSKYVGSDTTKELRITEGVNGKVFNVSKGEYNQYAYSDQPIDLDVYRMKGAEGFSGKQEKTFLGSNTVLFSFTPEESGYDSVMISLPTGYGVDNMIRYNPSTTSANDFSLTDVSVNQSVYAKALYPFENYYYENGTPIVNNQFILQFPELLVKGKTYELKLSSLSSGDEIQLPNSELTYYASIAYGNHVSYTNSETGEVDHYVSRKNIVKFNNITFTSAIVTPTTPPSSGSGGGEIVDSNPNQGKQVVSVDSLKTDKDGIVAITVSKEKPQVLLPIKTAEVLGDNKLRLASENISVDLPAKVLAKLQQLLPADQLEGAQIEFDFSAVTDTSAAALLNKAKDQTSAGLTRAGDVFDFSLSVITKDGKKTSLSTFDQPIKVSFKINATANKELLGVYYISEDGKLEYVGGVVNGSEIQAELTHFSHYAVLEYSKSYDDVADDYWASDIIKVMSAKHIIQGVSDKKYNPQANVTRAEFTSMLVRALGLKAEGTAPFADVSASAWYSEAITAASQAGLVSGTSASVFSPNVNITREEMAALLVRAYELKTSSKLDSTSVADFTDRSKASKWALSFIDAAYKAGFIQGRANNEFVPQAQLTRAESAKAIYTLLQ